MRHILTTDVWTEQHANHYECACGAFVDGIKGNNLPYDSYKIVENCNCVITSNSNDVAIGNKHNALIFYKNGEVVRLAVMMKDTNIKECVRQALDQELEGVKVKELLRKQGISKIKIDLKEEPLLNEHNNKIEIDAGSCDRLTLLKCMLKGSYTEDESELGNFEGNDFQFHEDIKIYYHLETDEEEFFIVHKGAFFNSTKTKAILLQQEAQITREQIDDLMEDGE